MATANAFRLRALECEEDAELTRNEPLKRRLQRFAEGWRKVSENQAWLDGEVSPIEKAARCMPPVEGLRLTLLPIALAQ